MCSHKRFAHNNVPLAIKALEGPFNSGIEAWNTYEISNKFNRVGSSCGLQIRKPWPTPRHVILFHFWCIRIRSYPTTASLRMQDQWNAAGYIQLRQKVSSVTPTLPAENQRCHMVLDDRFISSDHWNVGPRVNQPISVRSPRCRKL